MQNENENELEQFLQEDERELSELELENKRLREENERLKELNLKERMYEKVHVSVRTMDIFIGVMLVLLIIVLILGMLDSGVR